MRSTKKAKRPGVEKSSANSKKHSCPSSIGAEYLLGVVVPVVVGIILWSASSHFNSKTDGGTKVQLPSHDHGWIHDRLVARETYDESKTYKEIAEEREPVILRGTIAEKWPARKLFTTSFLASKINHVMAHRQEHKQTFITFHDNKPLEPYVTQKWEQFNIKVNTTIPNVLQWGGHPRPSKGPFLYYTQDVATLRSQFPEVIGYLQPIKDLILSEENVQVNLWVGRQGIVTHTHYDCTYNFFFQLQGRKRFTLFPPNQTMYLYPCLHPHYGHSQLDIKEPDYQKYPLFKSASPIVAEVGPGDMLVVPPFWYHHVETLSESVSVNVWSDAPEYALINEVYTLPIPFEEGWNLETMIKATKIFIDMILSSLGTENVQSFVGDLLSQRYDILMRTGQLRLNTTAPLTVVFCKDFDWEAASRHFEPILQHGVNSVVNVFSKIHIRPTLDICLGNYIEHLVSQVLGLDLFYPFLQHCASVRHYLL